MIADAVKSLRFNEHRGSNSVQLMCREATTAMIDRSPAFMRVSLASAAWIVITVLASGCNKTPSSVPNSVTRQMNAIGAGSELPDEWVLATSSTGDFSVLLPGKYNDFQQSARTVVGNQLTTHTVGLTTKAGVKYSVTDFEGGDPKPADEFLAGIITTFERSGSIEERHDLELEGQPGIQLVVSGPQSRATVRAFAFPGMT